MAWYWLVIDVAHTRLWIIDEEPEGKSVEWLKPVQNTATVYQSMLVYTSGIFSILFTGLLSLRSHIYYVSNVSVTMGNILTFSVRIVTLCSDIAFDPYNVCTHTSPHCWGKCCSVFAVTQCVHLGSVCFTWLGRVLNVCVFRVKLSSGAGQDQRWHQ